MRFSDVFSNEEFMGIAARMRVALRAPGWKSVHPTVPVWTLWEKLTQAAHPYSRDDALSAWTSFMVEIGDADHRLRHTEEEATWFVSLLDREKEEAATILVLLLATAMTEDLLFTPAELAAETGEAESTWRWRAAENRVPGVVKKGKQWLLPVGMMRAMKLLTAEQVAALGRGETGQIEEDD